MGGIGNTIETDLVGELIELHEMRISYANRTAEPYTITIARGRCRAVTLDHKDDFCLHLWLEVIDEACCRVFSVHENDVRIGDVIRVGADHGGARIRMRLIKEPG